MKWSFLASLLTSAAVLAPISASAKAEALSSAGLISGRLLASKSSALGITRKKDGGESQQAVQSDGQKTILVLDKLGRGGNEGIKAKSPDTLQLSRGLGSGGEGGGSPSQHAPGVKTKDISLPGRPMLANQQVSPNSAPIDGARGPSLASGSRSADNTFVMPTPVAVTVGQNYQSDGGTAVSSSKGNSIKLPSQDTPASSVGKGSEGSLSDSSSPSIGLGGSGGGGGGSSASQEGTVLPPEAIQEYQQLRAKAQDNTPAVSPKAHSYPTTTPSGGLSGGSISPQTLQEAKMGLKQVEQTISSPQAKDISSSDNSSKTVVSSKKPEDTALPSSKKESEKLSSLSSSPTIYDTALPSSKKESEKLSSLSSSPRIYDGGSALGNPKTLGRNVKLNIGLPEGILKAAEALGFDPSARYKDEREAVDELRKKASGTGAATEKKLDKVYGSIVGTPTATQLQEIERLSKENEAIEGHKKTLLEYLKKRSYLYPSEEGLKAAEALGFNPITPYKDEREALDELRKKASGKGAATEKKLDEVYGSIVGTPTATQLQEIERLSKENESIEGHKKTLIEYLKKRYATPSKGRRVIKVVGEAKDAWLAAIRGESPVEQASGTPSKETTPEKVLSLKEIDQQLTKLDMKIMDIRMSRDEVSGDEKAQQELDSQLKVLQKDKKNMQQLYEETKRKEDSEKRGPQATASVKVDPQKALKDQETLKVFKATNPLLMPLFETLSPDNQLKLLARKVTVLYNPTTNKHILEPIKMQGKVIQGATKEIRENVVEILKKLSPSQLNDFREFVAGLGKEGQVSAFDIPNIIRVAKYTFPDLVPIVTPVPTQKKTVVKKVSTEGEQAPKKPAPTTTKPKAETVTKLLTLKERMELLKDKSMSGGKFKPKLPLTGSGNADDKDK